MSIFGNRYLNVARHASNQFVPSLSPASLYFAPNITPTLCSYIPSPPLVLSALFPWGILFSLFGVFEASPLLGSTYFIEQLIFVIDSRKFECLNPRIYGLFLKLTPLIFFFSFL